MIAQRYAAVAHSLSDWRTTPPDSDREALSRGAVELGLYLALHHLDHALRLLAILPGQQTAVQSAMRRALRMLRELPDEFSRSEAVGVGDEFGFAPRSVDNYLVRLRKSGHLREGEGSGRYAKTPKGGGPSRAEDFRYEIITM